MKTTVTLDGKDVRTMIARFLGIKEEQVIPLRYNFAVEGLTEEEIAARLRSNHER